jgi:hypothetical protein
MKRMISKPRSGREAVRVPSRAYLAGGGPLGTVIFCTSVTVSFGVLVGIVTFFSQPTIAADATAKATKAKTSRVMRNLKLRERGERRNGDPLPPSH